MSKIATAIGLALVAAGNSLLDSFNEDTNGSAPTPAATCEAPKRRVRPPGGGTPPAEAATASAAAPAPAATGGKTLDELKAAFKPLVDEGRGEEVKKLIATYSNGGSKVADIPAANHTAFLRDVEALSM